ncbi:MAG: hypothetical protein AAGD11_14185 [Planctomycetota bacterium]
MRTVLMMIAIELSVADDLRAVIVESQSNPVANGSVTVAPGNNDRSDWDMIPSYAADPTGDGPSIDFTALQIAHDDVNVYFRMRFAPQSTTEFFGFKHNLYLDLDIDR